MGRGHFGPFLPLFGLLIGLLCPLPATCSKCPNDIKFGESGSRIAHKTFFDDGVANETRKGVF